VILRWNRRAVLDRESIYDFIDADNPRAALDNDDILWDAANSLLSFAGKGRIGRIKGTFELVVVGTPYIIAYRIELDAIRIMRIMHGAQKWPRRMSKQ